MAGGEGRKCLLQRIVMKILAPLVMVLAGALCGCKTTRPQAARIDRRVVQADKIVWVGLDYSMVRMIGTNEFRNTDLIFPGMFLEWNDLFIREKWYQRLGKRLGKEVIVDTDEMYQRNRLATPKQVFEEADIEKALADAITPEDIAAAVQSYQLQEQEGVGLVFVMDVFTRKPDLHWNIAQVVSLGTLSIAEDINPLVRGPWKGSIQVVFFDIATREVLYTESDFHRAGGYGFRNYWFHPVKHAIEDLEKLRKRFKKETER